MFEDLFLPYVFENFRGTDLNSIRDPIDQCLASKFNEMKNVNIL